MEEPTLPVKLKDVVDEMQLQMTESHHYINRKTGEIVVFTEEEARFIDEEELPDDMTDWLRKAVLKAREAVYSEDFVPLPDQYEIHEWEMLRDFAYAQDDESHREALLNAIHGKGAFRYFKDKIYEFGIDEDWYAFRDEAYAKIAIDFLEEHDIPYVRE